MDWGTAFQNLSNGHAAVTNSLANYTKMLPGYQGFSATLLANAYRCALKSTHSLLLELIMNLVARLSLFVLLSLSLALGASSYASDDAVPIFLPGAPGDAGRRISAEEAIDIADTSYSPDDVTFMQDMIPHHHQAVQMATLVDSRTNNEKVREIAGRIDTAQADEIMFMQGWLRDRKEKVPNPEDHHAMHTLHELAGMASPEDMEILAQLEGVAFDRKFLILMIAHHEGALEMVEHLLDQPGAAYDPVLYEFVNDINEDQEAEIEQMNGMLVGLSTDPRSDLKAGFLDAGQAIMNLELIVALEKPAGFYDPSNPTGLPLAKPSEDESEESGEDSEADLANVEQVAEEDGQTNDDTEWSDRSPLLSFSNTDMAFAKDVLVAGSYHGFNVYKLDNEGIPNLLSSIVCPGGQGDVSIVGDLLIMSVEQTRGRVDCGLQGIGEDVSAERFRGLRIFDISDLSRPIQVGQVQTCRGSHTHSVVSGPGRDGKIIVYNSGTAQVRENEEMETCFDNRADDRTALFRIDVIEIPVNNPSASRIIDSPTVFADSESGLAGLWQGGDHGEGTQETSETNQCHDITVFPEANIAAGACSGNGIIFDISNPRKPKRIDAVVDDGFAYWHSATFNNDATKVLFTDEWGGGSRPRCRTYDPLDWGANAIYDIVDGKLEFRSHFKIPAPQLDKENCVAHNGSVVPVPGRDIFVQAWYQGGMSVIDFTDSEKPFEIAYFDRGPISDEHLILGGYWSTYWYNGKIYGTEIARGLDVFSLLPSEYLTEHEIAAASLADQGDVFNPQQQFNMSWPAEPVVARALVDQLDRDKALAKDVRARVLTLLESSGQKVRADESDRVLSRSLRSLSRELSSGSKSVIVKKRVRLLADHLRAISERLR